MSEELYAAWRSFIVALIRENTERDLYAAISVHENEKDLRKLLDLPEFAPRSPE